MVSSENSRVFPKSFGDLPRKAGIWRSLGGRAPQRVTESEQGHESQGTTGKWSMAEEVSPPLGPPSFFPHLIQGKSQRGKLEEPRVKTWVKRG